MLVNQLLSEAASSDHKLAAAVKAAGGKNLRYSKEKIPNFDRKKKENSIRHTLKFSIGDDKFSIWSREGKGEDGSFTIDSEHSTIKKYDRPARVVIHNITDENLQNAINEILGRKAQMSQTPKDVAAAKKNPEKFLKDTVGSDFTVTKEEHPPWNPRVDKKNTYEYHIKKKGDDDIVISIHFIDGHGNLERAKYKTAFRHDGRWYNFDRLGVEDSWYFKDDEALKHQIEKQFARAEKSMANRKDLDANGVKINFGPTSRQFTKDAAAHVIDTLKAGKTYQVTPSGFGTGYTFTTRPVNTRYGGGEASKELSDLVGRQVYYTTFDHD